MLAPIAPGVISPVPIAEWRRLETGERVPVEQRYCTVALDGERAFSATPEQLIEVGVSRNGPPVVQVEAALTQAAKAGLFNT